MEDEIPAVEEEIDDEEEVLVDDLLIDAQPLEDKQAAVQPQVDADAPADESVSVAEGDWVMSSNDGANVMHVMVAGRLMRFETGVIGRLASGSVLVSQGETHVMSSACFERKADAKPMDFTPLRVDYCERASAAGRTPGGYIKRDGRPSEHETLVARLIDRPIRPLISGGWCCETQLASYVLAYDAIHMPDVMAVCAASAALALSEVPFPKPIAAVRVAECDGRLLINPTKLELKGATLDMVIAGTKEAVMMVEGTADFATEARLIEALDAGLGAVSKIATALEAWRDAVGATLYDAGLREAPKELMDRVRQVRVGESTLHEVLPEALVPPGPSQKSERELGTSKLQALALSELSKGDSAAAADGDGSVYEEADVKVAFKKLACATLREVVAATGTRSDGRNTTEVRPINIRMSPLPKQVHGSSLFTRGETQSLGTVTLGGPNMAQRSEGLDGEESKTFYLQYSFPPFSVGEVGRVGSPGRREIGHGNLAERALRPAIPSFEGEFPYAMRLESLITESCGSSSMASVCSGCLAMLAAGVPLKRTVAGVAMGLLLDEGGEGGEPIILTDILGSEDALGTMDFKVAGDEVGISAFQLDIKCEGLSLELMARALEQARVGRLHILSVMNDAMPAAADSLPEGVPRNQDMRIDDKLKGKLIGPGGATINAIIAESGVQNIAVGNSGEGIVTISSTSEAAIALAVSKIEAICGAGAASRGPRPPKGSEPPTKEIKVGDAYPAASVKNIVPFGIFVSLEPGKDGFCHISELSDEYIKSIEDVELQVGDKVDVTVTQVNNGRYRIEITSDFKIKSAS